MTTFNDEFYRDILEGLAIHSGSALQRDVLATISRHDEPRIGAALNKNQIASKMWLVDALLDSAGPAFPRVLSLGGWVGVLGAMLLHDPRFTIGGIVSIDIDPRCAPIAESINATHVGAGRFAARTADMLDLHYGAGGDASGGDRFDVVVNSSCEHLADFAAWYDRIPTGQLLVLQSNDYFACREHVNCVADLAAFRAQAPMGQLLFAGQRPMRHYMRFMLIGRK
jgi:hypothetical protein